MDKKFLVKTLTISLILNLLFGLSLLSIIQNLIFTESTDYPADLINNYVGVTSVSLSWWGIPALILFKNNRLVGFPILILQFFLGWFFWWIFISGVIFLKRIILKGLGK